MLAPIKRPYWVSEIELAWENRPIVWLSGVRRSGKTTLVQGLPSSLLMNCDLPSVRERLRDPETFYKELNNKIVIFDEIHRLENPSEILKIGADEHGTRIKILATGSSTLSATAKFSDALTGRKKTIHLVPILPEECQNFGVLDPKERLLRGGLPPALLAPALDTEFYSEWIDSFYARDIQELFRIEKRQPFIQLFELLLRQNGGMIELTQLGKVVGLSRPTIARYLEALEVTQAITLVRPFHGGGKQELVHQPKVYGFDAGFVAFFKGWNQLRPDDCGHLLENLVLESLQAIPERKRSHGIFYWRTKQQFEVDFVVPVSRDVVHTIECKWKSSEFNSRAIEKFREDYPKGENFLVCADAHLAGSAKHSKVPYHVFSIEEFRSRFEEVLSGSSGLLKKR